MNNPFDQDYYVGATKSSYTDYLSCKGVLDTYAGMLESIFSPDSVFDAGCAYGFVVDWFGEKGKEARGCDLSSFAVSHSERCYESSLESIPEPDSKYNLVTSTEVLEHIPEDLIEGVMKELHRISSKYVVMLVGMFPEGTTHDPADCTHITFHPREWWTGKVAKLGFNRNYFYEEVLNKHHYSISMNWYGRFIVLEK